MRQHYNIDPVFSPPSSPSLPRVQISSRTIFIRPFPVCAGVTPNKSQHLGPMDLSFSFSFDDFQSWEVEMFRFKFFLKTTWHLLAGGIINCWLTTSWMIYLRDITRENWQIRIFKPISWPGSAKNLHNNSFHEKTQNSEILFEVFHICNPVYNNEGGLDRMDKYSFVCGEGWCCWLLWCQFVIWSPPGTVFDQQTLTCNFPEDAFPCEESASLYGQVRLATLREAEMVFRFIFFVSGGVREGDRGVRLLDNWW